MLENEVRDEQAALDQAQAAATVREQNTAERRRELDRKELELKGLEEKIHKLNIQLNTASTNREYAAFQHEIATLKLAASQLEDDSLAILEALDYARKHQAEAAAEVKQADAALAARRKEVEALERNIDVEIAELRGKREALADGLRPAFREIYERLHSGLNGRAVVAARRGCCEGCYMNLTHNTVSNLMGENELIRCHSCSRILYLAREDDDL